MTGSICIPLSLMMHYSFVPFDDGNFGASWHTPSGQINGRAYNAFAYDSQGWWGPVRDLTGASDHAGRHLVDAVATAGRQGRGASKVPALLLPAQEGRMGEDKTLSQDERPMADELLACENRPLRKSDRPSRLTGGTTGQGCGRRSESA